jgi:hypothetical protein
VNIKNTGTGSIIVQWADGSTFGDVDKSDSMSTQTIDVTPNAPEEAA